MQTNRIDSPEFGNSINRSKTLNFTFDGQNLSGFEGDTVASALLANDIHLVARSIKYHRPRGILTCGLEEPSALVECTRPNGAPIPNLKATEVYLSQGLVVKSQNNWPSRTFDLTGALSVGVPLLQAGFYYKTFKWPPWGWHRFYEKIIRRFAGTGRIDTDHTDMSKPNAMMDQRNKFCQVLIVGSGPAGLNAALTCARQGLNVVLTEQDQKMGGSLLWRKATIGNTSTDRWLNDTLKSLENSSNVSLLSGTLAFGQYDHGLVLAHQTQKTGESGIFWKFRAERILLATGAIERPLVFANNDRPGIMLASAVRAYIHRYAIRPGNRVFVAIHNDHEKQSAIKDFRAAGMTIAATLESGDQIIQCTGHRRVRSIKVRSAQGKVTQHPCDHICVSGGWTPTAHLAAHVQGGLSLDPELQVPIAPKKTGCLLALGGTRGLFELESVLQDSENQASTVFSQIEDSFKRPAHTKSNFERKPVNMHLSQSGPGPAFVDLQNDVTRKDLFQAVGEGYADIELVKRYTATGMGTDQGKTSWVNAISEVAMVTGNSPMDMHHTTFRPPYSPVSFAGLAGAKIGEHLSPIRRTPLHHSFEKLNCVFQTSGNWLYSRYFPQSGESLEQAVDREVKVVRSGVGFVDMSTLAKFEVKGEDAETFLSRLYCNNIDNMPLGKVRYGLMLREDGIIFDDGTIARLTKNHYLVTATTANADAVWRWMTRLAQIQWPNLDVRLTNVSEHWAAIAITGPKSRQLLSKLELGIDVSHKAFPFASVREGMLEGNIRCRIYTVSYSGEISFEVNIPARYAASFVDRLLDVGREFQITPYGLETLDVLRIEKGHLSVGREIDGRTTPYDLGLGKMVSKKKDFLGRTLLNRSGLNSNQRLQLVGLTSSNKGSDIPAGAVLLEQPHSPNTPQRPAGWLTAAVFSPTLGRSIALALLRSGHNRHGDELWAASPITNQSTHVKVGPTCFYDPQGTQLHG